MIEKIKKMGKLRIVSISGISLLVIIIAVIVIFNLIFVNKELTTFKLSKEKVYIYFGEKKFKYTGNISLDYDNSIANIKLNDKEIILYSEPIYFQNKEELILPVTYSVVFAANNGVQNKVNYFTRLINNDNHFTLKNNDLNVPIENVFLYDGSDYYIFIDDSLVSFLDKEINISPMSYVNYIYDTKELYIYNHDEDKVYYFENVTGDVFVYNDVYKVNLKSDSLLFKGKNKLLMKNFDYLKKLK